MMPLSFPFVPFGIPAHGMLPPTFRAIPTSDQPFSEVYSRMCPEVYFLVHFKLYQVENQD